MKDDEPYIRIGQLLIKSVRLIKDHNKYIFSLSAHRRKRRHYKFELYHIEIPTTIEEGYEGIRPEIYERVMMDNRKDIEGMLICTKTYLEENPRIGFLSKQKLEDHPQIKGLRDYVNSLYEKMREKQYTDDQTEESPTKKLLCIDVI